jgi:hypothetical protein
VKGKVLFFVLGGALALPAVSQTPATPLVTQAVDETRLMTLGGSVHPLAQASSDRGAVADSFPAERLLLLLNRPPEREAAMQQFLQAAHTRGTATYHQWLTPEQFGAQFGPADADIQTATGWLSSHGFQVAKTSKSKQLIEFSGTAGQLREAFHTEIHQYTVNGETHYANATEVKIPEALTALVGGVSQMNDFRAQPQVKVAGKALYSRGTKRTTPQWTIPNPYGTANPYAYTVTPEDFATQYDLRPLYKAGVNGTGQTIGIINESNIDLSLVQAYQSLFGIAGSTPQVVIDGDDPGNLSEVDVEAYLDVELSGAVAPGATVNLYIAGASDLMDPLELAALRAVDDNQASVLSVSFGNCEVDLGNAGNQFWAGLWEQAAAQGQTVLVSAGDSGPVCSPVAFSISVSGIASTPWNVAVGGTDFYYSDYATGGASATGLWNQTNDGNLGSLIAPLAEQPWDDAFGLDVISDGFQRNEYGAGGGGASNCATQNDIANPSAPCTGGYAKPGWQTGSGVPADKVRDLPDVSLFASNGANLSAYAICALEGECAAGSGGNAEVYLVGGTSASSPAMAGIMALVNQKYGRQGQANYTLYPLAQQKPAAFHDITVGNNNFPCIVGAPETCIPEADGYYGTEQYAAGQGYDQASGLGSVDASVLVNNWSSIVFKPTTTTLRLSSTSVAHGTAIDITVSVAPSSGSGTPTGDVAILTDSILPSSQSQTFIALSGGAGTSSVNYLPGGEYHVTGRYGGDGSFASSTSTEETLTVTPEKANIDFSVVGSKGPLSSGGTVAYNAPLALAIQPTGVSAAAGSSNGFATGTATFTVDSMSATVALNAAGLAAWTPPALAVGTHTASASYSGDASYAAATSTPVTFSVTPGEVLLNDNVIGPYTYELAPDGEVLPGLYMSPGSTLTIGVNAQGWDTRGANPSQIPLGTTAPTGTVQVCLGQGYNSACENAIYSQTVTLAPLNGVNAQESLGAATFTNLAANWYYVSLQYNGDAVWAPWGLLDLRTLNVQTLLSTAATTTTLSITPSSFSGTQTATVTATVTGSGDPGTAPAGVIDFYADGVSFGYDLFPSGIAGTVNTVSFEVNSSYFLKNGANQLTAVYSGLGSDLANCPSVSNTVNFTATQTGGGDFTLAPQSPQVTVQAGSSATVGLNLQSLSSFSGAVALSCAPSSSQITCSLNPSTVAVNGQATAALTVNAAANTAALATPRQAGTTRWPMAAGMLCFGLLFIGGRASRKLRRSLLLSLCLFAAVLATSCGGGGMSSGGGGGGGNGGGGGGTASTPVTYSVLVTGTANGIVHNAKITVVTP